ncbi:hypothetical protein BJ138DRAFT_1158507 [Hygrophoropsis aurantiaca]|uniref:Uncharacterized protein n=1 Tax=Hygrophoropsis aurantiaca TaxID=72124 RepID=A0ACB8A3Y5_9AGAM|nr:hypothetical protein BJ138DRAFT_1158507 [Hygrophoropsis aurantiaca]
MGSIQCPVCYDDMRAPSKGAVAAICGHVFCRPCLKRQHEQRLAQQQQPACPMCRGVLDLENLSALTFPVPRLRALDQEPINFSALQIQSAIALVSQAEALMKNPVKSVAPIWELIISIENVIYNLADISNTNEVEDLTVALLECRKDLGQYLEAFREIAQMDTGSQAHRLEERVRELKLEYNTINSTAHERELLVAEKERELKEIEEHVQANLAIIGKETD